MEGRLATVPAAEEEVVAGDGESGSEESCEEPDGSCQDTADVACVDPANDSH